MLLYGKEAGATWPRIIMVEDELLAAVQVILILNPELLEHVGGWCPSSSSYPLLLHAELIQRNLVVEDCLRVQLEPGLSGLEYLLFVEAAEHSADLVV